jgi:hypothetical protein
MTITYRDTKGSDLDPAEVDANFRHVLDSANGTFVQSGTGALIETVSDALRRFKFAAQFGTFLQAVTAAITGNLRISSAVTVSADTTVPSTVNLRFERGGKLVPASGVTVTLNCPVEAGLWQIFDTSSGGTITATGMIVYELICRVVGRCRRRLNQ